VYYQTHEEKGLGKMAPVLTLPDISEVTPLSDKDQPMIDEIIDVLRRHGNLNRFGLVLLHQHFNLADDEVLVESTDKENRTQTTKPIKKDDLSRMNHTETSWRLDTGKPMMACSCIKFGDDHQHLSRG